LQAGGRYIANPYALLEEMSAETWVLWQLYYDLDPWGEERADLRSGMIAAVIAETNRDKKKRRKPYTPQEFMPQFDRPPPKPQTPEEQAAILRMWVEVLGGDDRTQAA
jgi:hypothetical protein